MMDPQVSSADPIAQYQHALALHEAGRLEEAATLYRAMLAQFPRNPLLMTGLGTIALQQGNLAEGIAQLEASLRIEPEQPMALSSLGMALRALGRLEEALASFDRAIARDPGLPELHNNRGVLLQDMNRLEEALRSFDRALVLNPRAADTLSNRGRVLRDLGRPDASLASCNQAIQADPQLADAYLNRGNVLQDMNRLEEALADYGRALALRPDFADAYSNRGVVQYALGHFDAALMDYDRAIASNPDHAPTQWNKANLKLLLGDYAEGWKLYESRWKLHAKSFARDFPQPLWLGDVSLAGKTLLVHREQGYGDFIQCCRYIPLVEALGAKVVVEAPAALVPLLSSLKSSCTLVTSGQPLPHFDLHCPIMSLPLAFGTTVETIPADMPYLFADPDRQARWRERLGPKAGMRVGIVWSGNRLHKNDLNRSMPARALAPLLALPLEFHVLQKEVRPDDAPVLARFANVHVHSAELGDFADTAALAAEMDLVISVDTSVAHLAGALGGPLWLLLPFNPDYRWLLNRTDSPWYPTATLFRQPAAGDWASVIDAVAQRLLPLAQDMNTQTGKTGL